MPHELAGHEEIHRYEVPTTENAKLKWTPMGCHLKPTSV